MATPDTMWSTPKVTVATRVEQAARARPPKAPTTTAAPRARTASPPSRANQVPEDHHALEADVDDAGPLGAQAAEPGEHDRRHGAEAAMNVSPAVSVGGVGDDPDEREQGQRRRRRRAIGRT